MNTALSGRLRNLVALLALLALSVATPAATITIVDLGGTAPANAVGGGTLFDIAQQAASEWAALIPEDFSLTIGIQWGPLGGTTLGAHQLLAQGGSPHRETVGGISFDNDGTSAFFLDPTPSDNSEFLTFTQSTADLGGGEMETGRIWSNAIGLAAGVYDLLSVARHEIGHALGLSSANLSYQAESWPDNDIDVSGPLPYAGAVIPTNNGAVPADAGTSNAHLGISTALLWPAVAAGQRREISEVDLLANAQLSQFDLAGTDIPEPATWVLIAGVFVLLAVKHTR